MGELIGHARCSTVLQDLTAQRQAPVAALGVRGRPDLPRQGPHRHAAAPAPAWTRPWPPSGTGDTLVAPKLDRLARSVPDACHIGDSLVARGIRLSLGGTIYDPADLPRQDVLGGYNSAMDSSGMGIQVRQCRAS